MKKSKSIVIHDFIMENFENGEAFRFDVLSGKTQMKTVSSNVNANVNANYLCPQTTQTTQKDYIYPYLSLGLPESET
ncbi:MAG: hypothetical protein KBT27_11330, partial [Prevotellaceae bacterium]|nr:hypothetical protein [Candidatus Faecinaster equi]